MTKASATRQKPLIINAIDGDSGKVGEVTIAHARLMAAKRHSLGQIKEAAWVVPEVLQRPAAIFEGLMRDADEAQQGLGWRWVHDRSCGGGLADRGG